MLGLRCEVELFRPARARAGVSDCTRACNELLRSLLQRLRREVITQLLASSEPHAVRQHRVDDDRRRSLEDPEPPCRDPAHTAAIVGIRETTHTYEPNRLRC